MRIAYLSTDPGVPYGGSKGFGARGGAGGGARRRGEGGERGGALASGHGARGASAARDLLVPWPFASVVHRDLFEEQILLGDKVGLIDLDDAALGPPELDAGNLLDHVELLSLRSGLDLEAMAGQLPAGYASSGAALEQEPLDRCRLLTLLRLACIHKEPALLRLAET